MKKRTTISLDEDVWFDARVKALKERRTLSEVVNTLLRKYLEDNIKM